MSKLNLNDQTESERNRKHCIDVLRELLADRNILGKERNVYERLYASKVPGVFCQPHPLIAAFYQRHRFSN
jgi:hypothetical protein